MGTPIVQNTNEQKSKIGLDSLYIAAVTQDDTTAYVTDIAQYLSPAALATQEPVGSFNIQYADNQPFDVMTAEAETKISLSVTGISLAMLAFITGRTFDATTGRMYDNGGVAPYFALGFRTLKSNGKYRYYWYLKGKFTMPKEETATLADKPDPKSMALDFTAIRSVYKYSLPGSITDSVKRVVGDDDTINFSGTTWFSSVQTPSSTVPAALSLSSSVPTNGASGVVVSSTLTLTFNNALGSGEEIDAVLINSGTGAVIAGTNTIDTTRKIVTVGHAANLAAATLFRIVYSVKDIYNQTLTGTVSFTTA